MLCIFLLSSWLVTVSGGSLHARAEIPSPAPASALLPAPVYSGKQLPIVALGPPGGLNESIIPSEIPDAKRISVSQNFRIQAAVCNPVISTPSDYWMNRMDHTGNPRGYAPFLNNFYTYPVWRNVLDYGAKNDGSSDATPGIQAALNYYNGQTTRWQVGSKMAIPAHVFLPGGTYLLRSKLDLRVGTIIMGDPQNPPIFKADAGFSGDTLVQGYDGTVNNGPPETSFLTAFRNIVIDTTAVNKDKALVALQWGVAQGCALGNVKIIMPNDSNGHIGIFLQAGSTIAVTDTSIQGGVIGIQNTNQQVNFKNIQFKYCRTAYASNGGFTALLQKVTFDTCGLGIDISGGGAGNIVLLDSTSTNSGPTVKFRESSTSGPRNNQVVINNLKHDTTNAIAVNQDNVVKLAAASTVDTWVWGNAVPGQFQSGVSYVTPRPAALLAADGTFFTKDAPTYAGYALDQFLNVKSVSGFPVNGDGSTDDSASLNAILQQAAQNCKIAYFPYGVYVVKSTLLIPSGSRIVGEAWAVISGAGSTFKDANNPQPIIKVGNVGDIGLAQISDMRFTAAEVLPGAIILQVNIAGTSPGDVGIWNTQVNIGGGADSTIRTQCTNQDPSSCKAVFLAVHLTASSSAYLQNIWVWTADHFVDGQASPQIISTGRGILVESTKATWLVGTGSEHHWLYNYNFNRAQNVFAGLLQTETPYMQGAGAYQLAPAPWVADSRYGDPDFSWCGGGDGPCRSSLGQNVNGGSNLFLYNTASWSFFDGFWNGQYNEPCGNDNTCQTNMLRVSGNPSKLFWYGIATKSASTVILDGVSNPKKVNNPGGWGANIAAYRQYA
ncbi:related to exo-beta-1,3-glucanase [Rhynchosporium secalis]|uniref:Related to exo-beta-1,3-glucanase n=1 Tax=Rhynchosporium secalis TaxID=38038 RepID=A0A1E1ML12_RHYSE|nr:related to exo-beta-1,3-glucanase [Rhynchosporium secalis]